MGDYRRPKFKNGRRVWRDGDVILFGPDGEPVFWWAARKPSAYTKTRAGFQSPEARGPYDHFRASPPVQGSPAESCAGRGLCHHGRARCPEARGTEAGQ